MTMFRPTAVPSHSFLNWRLDTDPATWSPEIALLGIPQSEPYAGDRCPNDQSNAPDAVRRLSPQASGGPKRWDFDLDTELSHLNLPECIDCGNVVWDRPAFDAHAARVTALAGSLFARGCQLFILGGDHGVSIPVIDALDQVGEPVYVVHIDAHLDWREEVGGVTRGYSSPLYWASQKPWVRGMTQIGMRGTGSARRAEVEAARAYGSKIVTAAQVHAQGLDTVLETIPPSGPIYVTIDADGIDPTEMPGVMAPVPGGIRFSQLAPFLRRLAQRQQVVGMDIVEIAPSFDAANGISCITAARLILNVLGASWEASGAFRRPLATPKLSRCEKTFS